MDPNSLTQNPFAALTFVAAPALLTNASSVLALGTINRMLRTRDRMHELFTFIRWRWRLGLGSREPFSSHATLLGKHP